MEHLDFCDYEHILDIGFVREVVKAVGMMTGPLTHWDVHYSGEQASGHAYCFVTGMSAGTTTGITPRQIAERLNIDALTSGASEIRYADHGNVWHKLVRSMWVFDATTWNRSGIRKSFCPPFEGASPEAAQVQRGFEWFIALTDDVQIRGSFEPPADKEDWVRIKRMAVDRINGLGWQANWPTVPEASDRSSNSDVALDFLCLIAQQLIAWPKTRALGLEILTGNDLPGFIDACWSAPIDMEVVVSMVEAERANRGEEPETDDEDDEAGVAVVSMDAEESGESAGPGDGRERRAHRG